MPKEDCQDRPDSYLMSITPGGKNEEGQDTGNRGKQMGRKREGGRHCGESKRRHGVTGKEEGTCRQSQNVTDTWGGEGQGEEGGRVMGEMRS